MAFSTLHPTLFFVAPTRVGLRGHTFKIHQQWCKFRHRQHAFSVRVVPYWNKLPEEFVNASSVEIFNLPLDARWQSFFPEVPSNPSPGLVVYHPYAIVVITLSHL